MTTPTEELVIEKLRSVIDPEVELNIVDMGLIYGVSVKEGEVEVRMTLTTQGCPMSDYLKQEVDSAVQSIEGVRSVSVQLVWEPAWSTSMIKPGAL